VLNEDDYQTLYYWVNEQLLSEEEGQENKKKYEMVRSKTGTLTITKLELGNLEVGERAWIEYMEFEVELNLSAECGSL